MCLGPMYQQQKVVLVSLSYHKQPPSLPAQHLIQL